MNRSIFFAVITFVMAATALVLSLSENSCTSPYMPWTQKEEQKVEDSKLEILIEKVDKIQARNDKEDEANQRLANELQNYMDERDNPFKAD